MSPREAIVLVVDDEAGVCEVIGELLESLGWRAETLSGRSSR